MINASAPEEITGGLVGMDLLQAAMDYHLGTFGVVFIAITLLLFSFFHLYRHTVLCQKQCILPCSATTGRPRHSIR